MSKSTREKTGSRPTTLDVAEREDRRRHGWAHEEIKRLIVSGNDTRFQPGKRIPSRRRLASDLGVAKRTIDKAIAELEAGGILVRSGRASVVPDDSIVSSSIFFRHGTPRDSVIGVQSIVYILCLPFMMLVHARCQPDLDVALSRLELRAAQEGDVGATVDPQRGAQFMRAVLEFLRAFEAGLRSPVLVRIVLQCRRYLLAHYGEQLYTWASHAQNRAEALETCRKMAALSCGPMAVPIEDTFKLVERLAVDMSLAAGPLEFEWRLNRSGSPAGTKVSAVLSSLRERIMLNDDLRFQPGKPIPAVPEIAKAFEAADGTVRKALAWLTEDGWVVPSPPGWHGGPLDLIADEEWLEDSEAVEDELPVLLEAATLLIARVLFGLNAVPRQDWQWLKNVVSPFLEKGFGKQQLDVMDASSYFELMERFCGVLCRLAATSIETDAVVHVLAHVRTRHQSRLERPFRLSRGRLFGIQQHWNFMYGQLGEYNSFEAAYRAARAPLAYLSKAVELFGSDDTADPRLLDLMLGMFSVEVSIIK